MNGAFKLPENVRQSILADHRRQRRVYIVGSILAVVSFAIAGFVALRGEAESGREKCVRAYALARTVPDSARVDSMRLGMENGARYGERTQPTCRDAMRTDATSPQR